MSGPLLSDEHGHGSGISGTGEEEEDSGEDTSSTHTPKRRRSNDWPLQSSRTNSPPRSMRKREGQSSRRHRPTSATRKRGESRFIEGSMHDRVSEQPPSAYIGEEEGSGKCLQEDIEDAEQGLLKKKNRDSHLTNNSISSTGTDNSVKSKQSGIFRFGKAIASIFNPMMWGSGSGTEDGKGIAAPASERDDKDALKLAGEKAYAELKKSGFKGTSKGENSHARNESGAQEPHHSGTINDVYKTPKGRVGFGSTVSLREGLSAFAKSSHKDTKTPFKTPAESPTKLEPVTSIKTSFSDIRKVASFTRPSSRHGSDSPAPAGKSDIGETTNRQHMSKKQSRKDLKKVKKLSKHVSDLEGQIEKAKRELRDLTGGDEVHTAAHKPPSPSIENNRKNKFQPGALPTLPSERILHRKEASEISDSEPSAPLPVASKSPTKARVVEPTEDGEYEISTPEMPSQLERNSKDSIRSSTVIEVPSSRKRKPAAVESESEFNTQPISEESDTHGHQAITEIIAPSRRKQPSRQAKSQKMAKHDSPGSAERKRQQRQKIRSLASDPAIIPNSRIPSRVPHPANGGRLWGSVQRQRSSPNNRRSQLKSNSYSNASPSPMLKAKKSTVDLRSENADNTEKQVTSSPTLAKLNTRNNGNSTRPLRHSHRLKPKNDEDEPSISPTKVQRKRTVDTRYHDDDYIPPVPPVPKALRATALTDSKGNGHGMKAKNSAASMSARTSNSITTVPEDSPVKAFEEPVTPVRDEGKFVDGEYEWPEDIF